MSTSEYKLNHNWVETIVKVIQTVEEITGQITLQFLMLCLRIIVRNNYSKKLNLFFARARFMCWVVSLYLSNSKVYFMKLLIDTTQQTFLEKDWKH